MLHIFRIIFSFGTLVFFVVSCGSTFKHMAVNSLLEGMETGESIVFTAEDDPELVEDAFPFMLKSLEMMMIDSPKNEKLKLSAASGFTVYANQWIAFEAKQMEKSDYEKSVYLKKRSARLYQRAKNYGLEGLEILYAGAQENLINGKLSILEEMSKEDVPLLYWTGVSWMLYIIKSNSSPTLLLEVPYAEALLKRALTLDEEFGDGALHEFYLAYDGSRIFFDHKAIYLAKQHFDKALEISKGKKCTPYLGWASTVSIKQQNKQEFTEMLEKALAIDPNDVKRFRLANKLCQREAAWYLENINQFFL